MVNESPSTDMICAAQKALKLRLRRSDGRAGSDRVVTPPSLTQAAARQRAGRPPRCRRVAVLKPAPAMVRGMTANLNRPAIEVRGLRKSYGDKVVLDGIDLSVAEGTIFSLLGPNGAGKTTVVRILATLTSADGGEVRVAGHQPDREPDAVRAAIGLTGQFSAVDRLLTGRENLLLMADLHHLGRREGRRRAAELLERLDLVEAGDTMAATYSGGMQRRLDLAMTLVGTPRVIFLDEPTTGLDPRSRRGLWQIIRELAAGGVTIFLTTQYLEEADQLAGRIALLDRGRVVAEGTPDELKRRIPGGHVTLRFADPTELDLAARTLGASGRDDEGLVLQVPHDGGVHALRALLARLDDASIDVESLTVHTPDLDDVFLSLTQTPEVVR
ncbi:daunorubicin resistance protein DrrA family ABC transporter ATP-binding protein [Phytohabitans houttuyneae]|uniref:Daunorubicin resistance protein DrrA family ABC transporter ATP-binding protein n=2 Tax=Phytohabitans houttuyneae TaxID=1076126 RepID=A0A6V8KNP0_9ACTN|nr:daunorubicin resistance protein DrrA family ABC transporter ATP-binding protein [Phytohabitans houttuyneae]